MCKYLTVYTLFCLCWKTVDSIYTNSELTQPQNEYDLNQPVRKQFSKAGNLDQSESQLYSSYVSVYTIDDGSNELIENDTDKYYIDEYKHTFYFRFNDDSKCVELDYLGKQVWKHNSDECGDEYPKEIFFQRLSKRIIITFPTFYLSYAYRNRGWKIESKVDLKFVFENGLSIIATNNKDLSNPKVNDTSKFDVKSFDYVYKYNINDNANCVEVRLGQKNVWKYIPKESKKGFPKSLYYHRDLGLIFMDFNNMSSMYRCNETMCKCISNQHIKDISVSDLKIHTIDPYDPSKIDENNECQYERKDLGYGYIFNMNQYAKMTKLLYKDKVLWYYGYKSKEYPKSVFLNTYMKLIAIKFSNFHLVYFYMNKWRYICKSSVMTLSESDVKIYTRIGDEEKENDQESYELVRYPYKYALMYNIKSHADCFKLMIKNKTVWKHNPKKLGSNYPTNIYINKDMKMVIVTSQKFIYVYVNLDKWRMVFQTVDKDILKKSIKYSNDRANIKSTSINRIDTSSRSARNISTSDSSTDSDDSDSDSDNDSDSYSYTDSDSSDSESSDEEIYPDQPPRKGRCIRCETTRGTDSKKEYDTLVGEPIPNENEEEMEEVGVIPEKLERGYTKEYVLGIVIAVVLLILAAGLAYGLYHTRKIKSRSLSNMNNETEEITVF
uniref:SfiI-subtelomeric related protein family member n=1 Tax=Theileria annulata TaxID=5874 RepID=A0A3B0MX47_THEAN